MALDLVVPPRLLADPTDPQHATRRSYVDRRTAIARPGDDLNAMVAALLPGDTLIVQGTHALAGGLVVAVSGTTTNKITLVGDGAIIQHADGRTGTGYAATITGAYLHLLGITFEEAAKACVTQGTAAQHIRFDTCVFRRCKNELFKVRDGATNISAYDCHAEDSGLGGSYGEGFYIGDAASNWPTPNVVPDTTSYVRLERCSTRRTLNDGFDLKEGAHHIVVKDCSVDHGAGNSPTAGSSQGDSGVYSRADTVQIINQQVRSSPGDGLKLYDVVVNSVTYGRGMEVKAGLVQVAGGAGVASQSDDLKVYSDFAIAGTVTGGRTNVVGGGWSSNYDPATFTEMTWSTPTVGWRPTAARDSSRYAAGGSDPLTPAAIGAVALALANLANGWPQLGADGKIGQAQLPAIALVDYLGAVSTQAAMLALVGQRGDWCTRTDVSLDYQLIADDPTQLANWRAMTYPSAPVSSVNGRTGAVSGVQDTSGKDAAGGYAGLDTTGRISASEMALLLSAIRAGTVSSALTSDASTGGNLINLTLTGNATLNLSTPTDHQVITYHLLASGAARTVTFGSSILCAPGVRPAYDIPQGTVLIATVEYLGIRTTSAGAAAAAWLLTRVVFSDPPVNPAAVEFVGTTATNIGLANATWTSVPWSTEVVDTANGHDLVTNPSRYTCQPGLGGLYRLSGGVLLSTGTTGTLRCICLAKNGAQLAYTQVNIVPRVETIQPIPTVIALVPGDYVELQIYQNSGAALASPTYTPSQCSFVVERVG